MRRIINKPSKEELQELIDRGVSYTDIGRIYDVTHTAVKKWAIKYGIELPYRRRVNPDENFSHPKIKKRDSVGIGSLVYSVPADRFKEIILTCHTWKDMIREIGYIDRVARKSVKQGISDRARLLGLELVFAKKLRNELKDPETPSLEESSKILRKTIKELYEESKNIGKVGDCVRKYSRRLYDEYGLPRKCAVCGYDKHIQVAHIKPIYQCLRENITVQEVNSPNNLIGLCPNHHWEFDHGFLSYEDIREIHQRIIAPLTQLVE